MSEPAPLDPEVRSRVSHLYGKTLADLLANRIEEPPMAPTEPVERVTSHPAVVAGPHGEVPVRVYVPEDAAASSRALVWCHGGAWMRGDLDMPESDAVAQRAAATLSAVVVAVDYRLAPNHTHPVPIDDVVAVFEAVAGDAIEQAPSIDPTRVGLGGASAGGHLAACASLVLAERDGARPRALFLAYPATDPVAGPWPDGERPEAVPELLWFDGRFTPGLFQIYLGGATPDASAVPNAAALERLPPTLVTTAELDALAPQARRFAERALAASRQADEHSVAGVLHGYLNMVGSGVAIADEALGRHLEWLEGVL